ncbi:MAG: TIGR04283 family arsenosugar biosynthesis glycosyltransferase [Congregibacter sp.]
MLSFVLPVLNEAAGLKSLLLALRRDFAAAELIVVDGGSTDRSVAIALAHADVVLTSEPGRATQMNLGAAAAKGEWLLFLHADSQPDFDASALEAELRLGSDWAFCRISLQGGPMALPLISWFINRRSRWSGIATGDQLLMLRRNVFAELGGFPNQALMEDVEICKRLRRRVPAQRLSLTVHSSGRRWEQRGVILTVLQMWALRAAYWAGASPERLWDHYYGQRTLTKPGVGDESQGAGIER